MSQRIDALAERGERRDALDQRLAAWLVEAGYLPVPVPNALVAREKTLDDWLASTAPDAVLLSGGNDPGRELDRDRTERALVAFAEERGRPLLGLCRGMQMLGMIAGVGLERVEGHVRTRHRIRGEIDAEVNSYHHLALAECPRDYEVLARAEDGVIEAIRHRGCAFEGWMWHPEREPTLDPRDLRHLRELFR